ncbi:hypothetical protein CERZMDRAFT_50779 [Cercospora zeae-maydis SCOH1-5]|uniref:Rab-GAP TBC domain-containing protein n=1 Tax=Cercospora zeae-maydis SCOH1-5 TaxID=717836 RepID=A0A6A6F5L8_9PEZI|nr:hypothetical protein CERZMDRAFT_50779 [Cercospora zeae-maydis SCOH1-5]
MPSPPPSGCSSPHNDQEKIARILAASRERDLDALSALASSTGGFIADEVRRTAWPVLLGCYNDGNSTAPDWHHLPRHREEGQVQLDVDRSFIYYPDNESETQKEQRRHELSEVITAVLRRHPVLCYFQGYHDIVQVLLLVLGADAAEPAAARLSLLRIRDFMLPTMSASQSHLQLLPAILYVADRELYQHLSSAYHPAPFFALAATLTLYAHDIEGYGDIVRLFDYLLASGAVVPVYLFAAIVITRKKELLEIDHDEPEMLHSILSKLPKPLHLEALITKTRNLFETYPPERLPHRAWRRVSAYSVLKTTRDPQALAAQSLSEGEQLYEKHAAEIRRHDMLIQVQQRTYALARKYRRPAKWTGAAIAVAVLALYMRRADGAVRLVEMLSQWGDTTWRFVGSLKA